MMFRSTLLTLTSIVFTLCAAGAAHAQGGGAAAASTMIAGADLLTRWIQDQSDDTAAAAYAAAWGSECTLREASDTDTGYYWSDAEAVADSDCAFGWGHGFSEENSLGAWAGAALDTDSWALARGWPDDEGTRLGYGRGMASIDGKVRIEGHGTAGVSPQIGMRAPRGAVGARFVSYTDPDALPSMDPSIPDLDPDPLFALVAEHDMDEDTLYAAIVVHELGLRADATSGGAASWTLQVDVDGDTVFTGRVSLTGDGAHRTEGLAEDPFEVSFDDESGQVLLTSHEPFVAGFVPIARVDRDLLAVDDPDALPTFDVTVRSRIDALDAAGGDPDLLDLGDGQPIDDGTLEHLLETVPPAQGDETDEKPKDPTRLA